MIRWLLVNLFFIAVISVCAVTFLTGITVMEWLDLSEDARRGSVAFLAIFSMLAALAFARKTLIVINR